MKSFSKWLENTGNKSSTTNIGPYKVELEDAGNGKLMITVSSHQDVYAIDSKGMVRKMIDVSSLQTSPSVTNGKANLTAPEMKAPMMDRMEPVDNRGAGGLPSP